MKENLNVSIKLHAESFPIKQFLGFFPQLNSYISCPQETKNSTQIETKEGKTGKKSATKSVYKKAVGGKQAKTGVIKKVVEKKTKKEVQPLIYEVIGNQKQVKSRKRSKSEKEER
jgi:hypothetical protein